MDAARPRWLASVGRGPYTASGATGHPRARHPLGARRFPKAALLAKRCQHASLLDKLPGLPDLQTAWLLLLMCACPPQQLFGPDDVSIHSELLGSDGPLHLDAGAVPATCCLFGQICVRDLDPASRALMLSQAGPVARSPSRCFPQHPSSGCQARTCGCFCCGASASPCQSHLAPAGTVALWIRWATTEQPAPQPESWALGAHRSNGQRRAFAEKRAQGWPQM